MGLKGSKSRENQASGEKWAKKLLMKWEALGASRNYKKAGNCIARKGMQLYIEGKISDRLGGSNNWGVEA